MEKEIIKIITYLNLLELPLNKIVTKEKIEEAYRKLSHIYHPDVANSRYKDGKKFIELKNAKEFLINNISYVNQIINGNYSDFKTNDNQYNYYNSNFYSEYDNGENEYERWKKDQEFKERWRKEKEEQQRREREEADRRKREELKRQEEKKQKEEIERRKREEEEKRRQQVEHQKKLEEERKNVIYELGNYLNDINKDDYYESEYNEIILIIQKYINSISIDYFTSNKEINEKFLQCKYQVSKIKNKNKIKDYKKKKRKILILSCLVIILTIFLSVLDKKIMPSVMYKEGLELFNEGDYSLSYEKFMKYKDYKNSSVNAELANLFDNNDYFEIEHVNNCIYECNNIGVKVYIEYQNEDGCYLKTLNEYIINYTEKKGYEFKEFVIHDILLNSHNEITITLYPHYIMSHYKITYQLNGGTNSPNNPLTYCINSTISLEDPKHEGGTFVGWYLDSDFSQPLNVSISQILTDIELYAKWDLNRYKINFILNGGEFIEEYIGEYGDVIDDIPTKFGYTFFGWYLDSNLTKKYSVGKIKIKNENITLYASWIKKEWEIEYVDVYKIDYNTNGGTPIETQYVSKYNTTIYPKMTKRNGYVFAGWYEDQYFTKVFDFSQPVNSDKTLFAKWVKNNKLDTSALYLTEKNTYVVSTGINFVPSTSIAASYTFIATVEGEYEIYVSAAFNEYKQYYNVGSHYIYNYCNYYKIYVNGCYRISGSNERSQTTCESFNLNVGDQVTIVFLNEIVKEEYDKTYYSFNDCRLSIKTPIVVASVNSVLGYDNYDMFESVELKLPSREGYEFIGWYNNPEYKGELIKNIEAGTQQGDIILYAKWQKQK